MKRFFDNDDIILFQGDSITDCGRNKDEYFNLGDGYPQIISNIYHSLFPNLNVTFINRGISGNRIENLLERYEKDFLEIKPSFICILIGINDVWRRYDRDLLCPPEKFEKLYEKLISKIKTDMPDTKILLISPFVLHSLPDRKKWHEDLDPKIKIVSSLAVKHAIPYLPLQKLFDKAIKADYTPEQLAEDGVHPTPLGHALIAAEILKKLNIL